VIDGRTPEALDADEADDGPEPPEDGDLAGTIDPPPGPYEMLPKRIQLDTELAVRRQLVRIFRDVREGRLSSLEGNRMAKLLMAIGQSNERITIEKRLRKLEAVEESRRRSTRR
jgi:hypothetical protein